MDARRAAAVALALIGFACRLLAIALCALTVLLCFGGVAARLNIAGAVVDLSRALPDLIAGYGVVASPFGGVFRLDFALTGAFLFLIDYGCARCARALRQR